MIEVAFIFTATMVILAAIKLVGHIFGNTVTLPGFFPGIPLLEYLTPTFFLVMYPSIMFQIWFWSHKLGVLT